MTRPAVDLVDAGDIVLEITTHADRSVTVEVLTAEQLWERWLAGRGVPPARVLA